MSQAPVKDQPATAIAPRRRTPRRDWGWRLARAALVVVLVLATVLELAWYALTATVTHQRGASFNQGHNAIWIAHTWVGDPHDANEFDALAAELRAGGIRDVYAHVGPLKNDGTIPPDRYPYAAIFASNLHVRLPGLRIFAWIGQIYRIGAQPDEPVIDIALPETRQRVAITSARFVSQLGFDGVHYDLEPIPNNDSHFLDLLQVTRKQLGSGPLISVATPNWVPIARIADGLRSLTGRQDTWWTTFYYGRVSLFADQLVVMLYNTGMPTAPLYQMIAQQSTAHILRAVQENRDPAANPVEVIIGLPVYRGPQSRAFHATAENLRTGLLGVTAGLNSITDRHAFAGVAIYPEWLVTAQDWETYHQLWSGG